MYPLAILFKGLRTTGLGRLPHCRRALMRVGVLPVRNHYYEPFFDATQFLRPPSEPRALPGIDWNEEGQLEFLRGMDFARELSDLPRQKTGEGEYFLDNEAFLAGDAEYWYSLIRRLRPRRIYEVGSGYSTLIAARAIRANAAEDAAYRCRHLCIEPYEQPWLEKLGIEVVRRKVEDLPSGLFDDLEENDLLFIDSSHVIRPHGDVLRLYLEVLPRLRTGVFVHLHDVFTPRDYPEKWMTQDVWLWNEQYLLEVFLSGNPRWRIIGGLNFLKHSHYDRLKEKCPHLDPCSEPGSFYIQKV